MNNNKPHHPPTYPARYFDASPTWFAWNKVTASDIASLHEQPDFAGQHIYFHLNHPIRFVCLVGLVTEINVVGVGGRYILITLDDSSGTCIEVKTEIRTATDGGETWPSNTQVDNLHLVTGLGHSATLRIDGVVVEIGTVVKVKGSLDSFRENRQVRLERIRVVKDTNEEATAWAETAEWKQKVLGRPWVLSQTQREENDVRLAREAVEERQKARKRRVLGAEHERKKAEKERAREERRRLKEVKMNEGALAGSSVLPFEVDRL